MSLIKIVREGLGDTVAVTEDVVNGVRLRMTSQPLTAEEAATLSSVFVDTVQIPVTYLGAPVVRAPGKDKPNL